MAGRRSNSVIPGNSTKYILPPNKPRKTKEEPKAKPSVTRNEVRKGEFHGMLKKDG